MQDRPEVPDSGPKTEIPYVNRSQVALIGCHSYDEDEVRDAVREGLRLLGGARRFLSGGERALLKPNVLRGDDPALCVSTHPAVLKAVAQEFQKISPGISYGDSPGSSNVAAHMRKSGLSPAAEEIGLPLADFENAQEIVFKKSPFTKKFPIAQGVLEHDALISLPKLKTHMLTRFTGAVKNQFGCVPGTAKKGYHVKIPDVHDFSKMLVSLTLSLRPRLYIMDGIMAMEGNGPGGGDPVPMHGLLFSTDPVALDAVACMLIDLPPERIPTMKPGRDWGLGTFVNDEMEILGDSVRKLRNGDFNIDRGPLRNPIPEGIVSFFKNFMTSRPVIDRHTCIRCGVCVETCPVEPKALNRHSGRRDRPPSYRYTRCIRCYCCQEICPEGAISVAPGLFHPFGRS
jgi:uncharacterized protein (DUF362 family)/NAD-dependent dihydropyrimidine dehydrogenase PreA subunit